MTGMTDREFAMLVARIDGLDKRIEGLTEEFREFAKTCVPCRQLVNTFDSQNLDNRVTKMEHAWSRMLGVAFGGTLLGGSTMAALIRILGLP